MDTFFNPAVACSISPEIYTVTVQSGSYRTWQLGQMRIILQVSFVTRTNDVWKPSSYPQLGHLWNSCSIFMDTGFGVLFSKCLLLYLRFMLLLMVCAGSIVRDWTETFGIFQDWRLFRTCRTVQNIRFNLQNWTSQGCKTSGSNYKFEPAWNTPCFYP